MATTKVRIHGREYDLDPSRLTFREGKKIEQWTGGTFTEFGQQLGKGSLDALSAYALVLMQRDNPAARMDDIDNMGMNELEFVTPDEDDSEEAVQVGGDQEDPSLAA